VYGFFNGSASTDGYLALPENALGTDYLVLSYRSTVEAGWPNGEWKPLPSECAIVASQDNTTVTITPSIQVCSHPAGVPYNVVVNKGKPHQLQGNRDLPGTRVTANNPIAVFSAHAGANVRENLSTIAADYLVEQPPPVPTWGK